MNLMPPPAPPREVTTNSTDPPPLPWEDNTLNETPTEAFRVVFRQEHTVTFSSNFASFEPTGEAQELNLPIATASAASSAPGDPWQRVAADPWSAEAQRIIDERRTSRTTYTSPTSFIGAWGTSTNQSPAQQDMWQNYFERAPRRQCRHHRQHRQLKHHPVCHRRYRFRDCFAQVRKQPLRIE